MIPLIIFQEENKLLKETTATVKKMRAHYRHLKRSIEIEYLINLDMAFSLMIDLNEFDEPEYVYIKTLKETPYQKIQKGKTYTISSDREVVVLAYEHITKIAHNTITYDEAKEIEIRAKMINTDKDPFIKMTHFKLEKNLISFTVNGKLFEYSMKDFMPQLFVDMDYQKPVEIYDNYYIYDIKFGDKNYKLAIMHFRAFYHHYLFRDPHTKTLSLSNNTLYDNFNNSYYFRDGLIVINDLTHSIQNFFDEIYEKEYKQYIFNAIRDKNLYTEIALAFEPTKHHSFNVYDLKTDERLMGRVDARVEYNKRLTPELVITLREPFNQFMNKKQDIYEFRMPLFNLLKLMDSGNENYRLIDYGYFLVNQKFAPVTPMIINKEELNYVTASSSRYVFSIAIDFLRKILEALPISLIPMIKAIDKNAYIPSHLTLKRIDFLNREIELRNVFSPVVYGFDEIDNSELMVKEGSIFNSDILEMFALKLSIKPSLIEFNPVNPSNYDEIALLIKYCEDDDYLIEDIEKDCLNFARSMRIVISSREFMFVLNLKKNCVYFLDLTNHTSSKDLLESMSLYIKQIDKDALKEVLKSFSLYSYIIKDKGYGSNVNKDLYIVPFVAYSGIEPFISGIIPKVNVGNLTLNSQLASLYQTLTNVYKEAIRGIYANNQTIVKKVYLKDSKLYIDYISSKPKTLEVSLKNDGAYICYDLFGNKEFLDYDKSCERDSYGPIAFFDEIAIDMEIVKRYLDNNSLTLNGYAYIFSQDKTQILKGTFTELEMKEYNYTESVYVLKEVFFGGEFFGIISLDSLEYKDTGSVYYEAKKATENGIEVLLVPFDFGKCIIKV